MGRPKKKADSHYGQGTVCKLADGRWCLTLPYKDLEGNAQRLKVSSKDLDKAKNKLQLKVDKLNIIDGVQTVRQPGDRLNRSSTLHDTLLFVIEHKYRLNVQYSNEKPLKSRTIAGYNTASKRIDELVGDTLLRDVDEGCIMFILETFQKGNSEIGITPKSDTFLGNIYTIINLTLDFGVVNGVIEENILKSKYCKISRPKSIVYHDKVKAYSDGEIKTMLTALKAYSVDRDKLSDVDRSKYQYNVIHLYTAFMLMLSTGMRCEEILGLTMKSINFETGQLKIAQAQTYEFEFDGFRIASKKKMISDTKTRQSCREIIVSDEILNLIKMLDERNKSLGYTGDDLFISEKYITSYGYQGIQNAFNRFFEQVGVDIHFRGHRLRHTAASLMEDSGRNQYQMMSQLGISQLSTLRRYTDRGERLQRQNSEIIASAIQERYIDSGNNNEDNKQA